MDYSQQEQSSPFIDTPDYTFTLPDLSVHDDGFRRFLEKDLIECSTLNSLENSQRLNWWSTQDICRKVYPLSTSGDGNCLLHAASLATWGFHDRRLTLRKALHNILSEGALRGPLWRRWRFHQTRINKEAGLIFTEKEWAKEWDEIVALASAEPRNRKNVARRRSMVFERQSSLSYPDTNESVNATYDSLEEIHVQALSCVLRRPIIVISDIVLRDINGEALAPISFGGVYLPLDVQASCNKIPLLLAYDMAHFSALVTMESSSDLPPALIPLTDYEGILLPINFCIDPGENFNWSEYNGYEGNWALSESEHILLLKEYLEVTYASVACSPEDEIYEDYQSDEENDRRNWDGSAIQISSEENTSSSPELEKKEKGKSAKLQNVAKQFGSIGKSMSKKIRKNIAKLGKNSNKTHSSSTPTLAGGYVNGKYRLLCAQLRAKRHKYQEEMIKNYLECAYKRFLEDLENRIDSSDSSNIPKIISCINSDCSNYGTEKTHWMCTVCYEKQKKREASEYVNEVPRYGTGNSKFYMHSDQQSHNAVKRLPSFKKLNDLDQTLYLGKSTFYNDMKSSSADPYNQLGIPLSPSPPSSYTGKTTVIPIKVEGRDELLINSESYGDRAKSSTALSSSSSSSSFNTSKCPTECFSSEKPNQNSYDFTSGGNTKCRSTGCSFYGSPQTGSFCSRCCQERKLQGQQQYRKLQTEI